MGQNIVAVGLGIAAFAAVLGMITLTVRLYRAGGHNQRRALRAALAAAFIVSVGQAAGSDGGFAAAFPILFTMWVLIICLVVLAVTWLRRHRDTQDKRTA